MAVGYALDLMRDTGLSSAAMYRHLVRLERAGRARAYWQDGRRLHVVIAQLPAAVRPCGRPAWWLPALAVALVEAAAALSRPAADRLPDLAVYLGASAGLRDGTGLYDFAAANHDPFTYPPFAGLLFLPLTYLGTVPVQLLWTAGTVLTVFALAHLAAGRAARCAPLVALALAGSAPVSSDVRFGQVSLALAALVAVDVLAGGDGRYRGVLVGVAAAVKLTPLVFVPMLWCGGRRRAAVVAGWTFVACGALAGDVLPADSWRYWGADMWRLSRVGDLASTGNQSLNGALMRFGVPGPVRPALVLVVGGAVAVLAVRRAARLGQAGDWLSATVVVGAAGIVLSPVSWTHHQVWTVLGALLPVRGPAPVRWAWSVAVLAVMVLPVALLGPPVWSNARLVTAVAIACLVPLNSRCR
ncbi:MAG: DUF2029 domain-containing protein [Actinobacteria bacterium]|nr:MAG: DUF2029 domain-containing protein [Actinomycetota bacterium]